MRRSKYPENCHFSEFKTQFYLPGPRIKFIRACALGIKQTGISHLPRPGSRSSALRLVSLKARSRPPHPHPRYCAKPGLPAEVQAVGLPGYLHQTGRRFAESVSTMEAEVPIGGGGGKGGFQKDLCVKVFLLVREGSSRKGNRVTADHSSPLFLI